MSPYDGRGMVRVSEGILVSTPSSGNGCSIAVDFREKGFCSPYTQPLLNSSSAA
jgi:hypothetical protein